MKIHEMIGLLNRDLSRERMHMLFYLQSACIIQGLQREYLRDMLLEEAKSEMEHVKEFSDLIVGLGGMPDDAVAPYPHYTQPRDIISHALMIEEEVIKNYLERMEQAEKLEDKVNGKYIVVFLEEQLLHSRKDADHFRQMLKGSL